MNRSNRAVILFGTAIFALGAAGCASDTEAEDMTEEAEQALYGSSGRSGVYVMDNVANRNAVVRFLRGHNGRLFPAGTFPTGGLGSGGGLGSQGAVVLSENGRRLFVVNAGSDEISLFDVRQNVLVLRDIVGSQGASPISLTVHDDVVYVLNAGRGTTAGNIAGFRLDGGTLVPIADSLRPLSAAAVAPAQIGFDPSGGVLVVTEKATNQLTTYLVDAYGLAGQPIVTPSHGTTPFGFAFDRAGTLIVSEAFGGAPNASAISSYRLSPAGIPTVISGSVPTAQSAACWVAIGRDDRFAYATNTGSDTVSGLAIGDDGSLALFGDGGVTANTGDSPIDLDFTADGRFLYVLDANSDSIDILRARKTGGLELVDQVTGLAASTVGIAAF